MGVVIVLLLSASVSTLCSITLTASSTFSIDFVKSYKKDMSNKKLKVITKVLCILFVALSYVVANTQTPILDMMSYSWGIISGSFLAPYVLALYSKKLTKGGAWCGILGGFLLALIPASCKVITLFGVTSPAVVDLAGRGPLFACAAMMLSIILCLAGSLIFRNEKDDDNSEFFYNAIVENEQL